MTYIVHVFGLGEVCRVPSLYHLQAYQFFNAYAKAGLQVMLFRDGVCLRSYSTEGGIGTAKYIAGEC